MLYSPTLKSWAFVLFLLATTTLAYLPALRGEFIWDDDKHIAKNPQLRSLEGLREIWFEPGATVQYYPLSFTTFWIGYHLWGLHPLGYHLLNVALHVATALMLWRVLLRLEVPGAPLAALIFALHPVHVMSVAWMTELKNVLSGVLFLIALAAYLRYAGLGREGSSGGEAEWSKRRPGPGDRVRGNGAFTLWPCLALCWPCFAKTASSLLVGRADTDPVVEASAPAAGRCTKYRAIRRHHPALRPFDTLGGTGARRHGRNLQPVLGGRKLSWPARPSGSISGNW